MEVAKNSFSWLFTELKIMGISVEETNMAVGRCQKLCSIAKLTVILVVIHFLLLHGSVSFFISVLQSSAVSGSKVWAAICLSEALTLLLWYSMYFSHRKWKTMLQKIDDAIACTKVNSEQFNIKRSVVLAITADLVLICSVFFFYMSHVWKRWYCTEVLKYLLNYDPKLPETYSCVVTASWVALTFLFTHLPPAVTTLFYVFACWELRKLLSTCKQFLLSCKLHGGIQAKQDASQFLILYENVLKAGTAVEKAMSVSVFILFAVNFVIMFIFISTALGFEVIENIFERAYIASFVMLNTVSFLGVTFSASEVNTIDSQMKKEVHRLAVKKLLQNHEKETASILTTALTGNKRMKLTALKVFHLEKAFIAYAFGGLITYSILVLQLKRN